MADIAAQRTVSGRVEDMNTLNNLKFCTLFDSNYIDKGLALYHSMKRRIGSFRLYIFAFDDRSYEILSDMRLKNVVLIPLSEIMDDRLRALRKERTRAEFCWTCTPIVIEYVLVRFQETVCTYIDADIYFFANPEQALLEIQKEGCSVGVVPHRFERNYRNVYHMFYNGKYCIQFNTFFNDRDGLAVLGDWKKDCLNWCYCRYEDGKYGDQKYSDRWKMKYSCVYETDNLGMGVAPWNLHLYSCKKKEESEIWMSYRKKAFPLIFYHFEGMKYLNDGTVYLNLWEYSAPGTNRKVRLIYNEYFNVLRFVRKKLKTQYGLSFDHMTVNKKVFLGKSYSLEQHCRERGLADGFKAWLGFKINNFVRVN